MLISMFDMASALSGSGSTSSAVRRCDENVAGSRSTALTSS